MHRTFLKRATAALAGVAISTAGVLALAPPASAAGPVAATLTAPASPIILRGNDVAAPDLTLTLTAAAHEGDTIDLRVSPAGTDCTAPGGANGAVSWNTGVTAAAVPAVPNTSVTTSLQPTDCVGIDVPNTLRLTFHVTAPATEVPSTTVIKVSGIKYDIPVGTGDSANFGTGQGRLQLQVNGGAKAPGNGTVAPVVRIAGTDRYATAAELAKSAAKLADPPTGCAEEVVLVNGENFPDALAASYLGLPILLTKVSSIPDATKNALTAMGVGKVTIVGGTSAVDSGVFLDLKDTAKFKEGSCGADAGGGGLTVERISDSDRYRTAEAVAKVGTPGTLDTGLDDTCNSATGTVVLASGENFPDALAAGALTSSGSQVACGDNNPIPLLLTQPGSLRADIQETLVTLVGKGVHQVVIVGGTTAVSDTVKNAVDAIDGIDSVVRVADTTRQGTALALAKKLRGPTIGLTNAYAIASGANFPDALVGGKLASVLGMPILLSDSASSIATVSTYITLSDPKPLTAVLYGGTVALNQTAFDAVGKAFTDRNV